MKDSKMYKNELESSFNLLKKGEIIAMPTDTFYGLSCDCLLYTSDAADE